MTNLQYAIMEAYRDNLLSPDVTMDMLEAAQARLGPNGMTDSYLKEVKNLKMKLWRLQKIAIGGLQSIHQK